MAEPRAPHTDHDLLLIAAFAAGDVEAGELARAGALVAACGDCATLAADLQSIARATGELPAPRRPRDFYVTPREAARLRPRGLRRFAAAIAGPRRLQLARPLAGGLMMVGFAGLLVASLPDLSPRAAGTAADQRIEAQANPTPDRDIQGGQPQVGSASGQPQPSGNEYGDALSGAGQASPPPGGAGPGVEPDAVKRLPPAAEGPSLLVIASLALVAAGAALFLASLLRRGPLRS